jgi:phosphatidate cytidylyltransferase
MEPQETNEPYIDAPPTPSKWAGLQVRAISSVVLAAIVLTVLWLGGFMFALLVVLAALIMAKEWHGLTEHQAVSWRVGGLVYIAIPCASLIWLRMVRFAEMPDAGLKLVLFVMLIVVATDIGAYFAGRKIGGPKMAPSISPGKTWAGLGGGVAAAGVVGGIAHSFSPYPVALVACVFAGALLALLAQAGDLFESYVKRRAGVKDSGTLIPGHGGLLDRVDGLTLTVPAFAWMVYLSGMTV